MLDSDEEIASVVIEADDSVATGAAEVVLDAAVLVDVFTVEAEDVAVAAEVVLDAAVLVDVFTAEAEDVAVAAEDTAVAAEVVLDAAVLVDVFTVEAEDVAVAAEEAAALEVSAVSAELLSASMSALLDDSSTGIMIFLRQRTERAIVFENEVFFMSFAVLATRQL